MEKPYTYHRTQIQNNRIILTEEWAAPLRAARYLVKEELLDSQNNRFPFLAISSKPQRLGHLPSRMNLEENSIFVGHHNFAYARINNEAALIRIGDTIELWNPDILDNYNVKYGCLFDRSFG